MYKIRGTKVVSPYPVSLTPAESRLVFTLQRHFAPEYIFPDLYFPKVNFRTKYSSDFQNLTISSMQKKVAGSELIQIDCLAINDQGVFIFESKDYAGWLYGDETSKNWTQVLNFGNDKHAFYNPIRQNQLHLDAVSDFLGLRFPLYSVIVFGNDAEFKTRVTPPANCHIIKQSFLIATLKKIPSHKLSLAQITEAVNLINKHRILPTNAVRTAHISAIAESKNML